MDAPTPDRKPPDRADLIFAPLEEPNPQVLALLAEAIREGIELARKRGEPKINPKKWEPANPDAAPTPLTEAVHQAEDAIRDLAAASQPRAKELAEQQHDRAARIQAAKEHLVKIAEKLARKGVVVVARATEAASVAK